MLASKLRNPSLGTSQADSHNKKASVREKTCSSSEETYRRKDDSLWFPVPETRLDFQSLTIYLTILEAGAWSEPPPPGSREVRNDGITPDQMHITRATDVAVVFTDPEREV